VLFACLAAPARAGDRPWTLIRGPAALVVGQQSPKVLQDVATEIEQFRVALGASFREARQPPAMPTLVYTFADRKAMEPFVPLYHGKPAALGGYCLCGGTADANLIVASLASHEESSAIIFHEYTHLLIRNASRPIPVWLNEGIAEYYSTFRLTNGRRRAEIGRPIDHHVALLRTQMIPVPELLAVSASSPLYNEGDRRSVFYAEAWALTHYLLTEQPNGAAAINKYVSALIAQTRSDKAFEDAFGATPTEIGLRLRQYILRPAFKSIAYVFDASVDVAEPQAPETLPAAEVNARLGRIQLRINRAAEAGARIEAAAADAHDNAEAQLALALLRLQQHRPDDAREPLERAVTLAPADFVTQYLYGLLLLRDTIDAPHAGDDKRELAHAALTRAVAANPQSADALVWQAYADLAGRTRLEEARAATARAIALEPEQQTYRIQLVDIEEAIAEQSHPRPRFRMDLREVKAGEERVFGDLVAVDCGHDGVRFSVQVGARLVVAAASRLADVALRTFASSSGSTLSCGRRTPTDRVYLTSKAGQAVAVEFLPHDYVP
jgi:tetratricopeptide (TPR) repeat protein